MVGIQWQTASPLWADAIQDEDSSYRRFKQPALLRFASDTFMEDLQRTLGQDPAAVRHLVLRQETWQTPQAGWPTQSQQQSEPTPKLFQPAHQRFYLVAANLVCRMPGLPERQVDTANDEQVFFVLRRLVARTSAPGYDEYAWCQAAQTEDPADPNEQIYCPARGWTKLDSPQQVMAGEERLPLFGLAFSQDGQQRRLLAGLVPVSSRETFQAAGTLSPLVPPAGSTDPLANTRLTYFQEVVVAGFEGLREALENAPDAVDVAQAQETLLFTMLDFAQFVQTHLNADWAAIEQLGNTFYASAGSTITWRDALQDVLARAAGILDGSVHNLSFLLPNTTITKPILEGAIDRLTILDPNAVSPPIQYSFDSAFQDQVEAALNDHPAVPGDSLLPPGTRFDEVPKLDARAGSLYAIRCVYERPCGQGVKQHLVSERSRSFQLASFFDPDAPVRPMRITMPIDTSIQGLRQFPKGVSFLVSNELRKQMERIDGLKLAALDDGDIPGESPGIDLGMICSFSIPIITICALILLMIIVQLLNIVFWWLPLFKICLPLNLSTD
jgi:hypothetical protein